MGNHKENHVSYAFFGGHIMGVTPKWVGLAKGKQTMGLVAGCGERGPK